MFVARMIRRCATALMAASCASPSSDPCSGTISTPADDATLDRLCARTLDLASARQKAQHLAGRSRQHAAHCLGDRLPFTIFNRSADESRPATRMTGASSRNARNGLDLERRRHHDDAQVVASAPRLPRQGETEIGMNASLVEFVEDDGREIGKQRILLQARRQNAFSDDEQARVAGEALFESDLPADFAADRPALVPRAIRRATARAARRRGCRRMTGPASTSAGGMRVVLPAPGDADSTTARRRASVSRTSATCASITVEAAVKPRASRSAWMSGSRPRNRR